MSRSSTVHEFRIRLRELDRGKKGKDDEVMVKSRVMEKTLVPSENKWITESERGEIRSEESCN